MGLTRVTLQVSQILLDGEEQANFSKVSSQLWTPDARAAAFIRHRPEAPFLKEGIEDLKRLSTTRADKICARVKQLPFPDVNFIYKALQQEA